MCHHSVYEPGRGGLLIQGFATRLIHPGRSVSVVGDITMRLDGVANLVLVITGPGELALTAALAGAAGSAGAKVIIVTAQPQSTMSKMLDEALPVSAQTMAANREPFTTILSRRSFCEEALFILSEMMVLEVMLTLGISVASTPADQSRID